MSATTYGPELASRQRTTTESVARSRLFVCAECSYAQLFAVQPRALCVHPEAPFHDKALFAGQVGCSEFVPSSGADGALAWCSPGPKVTTSRFKRKFAMAQ
jgi:hypothetical protein